MKLSEKIEEIMDSHTNGQFNQMFEQMEELNGYDKSELIEIIAEHSKDKAIRIAAMYFKKSEDNDKR